MVRDVHVILDCLPHGVSAASHGLLGSDNSHDRPHLFHLKVVALVAVGEYCAVAVDNAANAASIDVAAFTFAEIVRRRHLQPYVQANAIEVLDQLVEDNWLEMLPPVCEEDSVKWRLPCLRMGEVRDDCLGNDTQALNHFINCDACLDVYQTWNMQPTKDVGGGTIIVYAAQHAMLTRVDHDNVPLRQDGQLLGAGRAGYRPKVDAECLQF